MTGVATRCPECEGIAAVRATHGPNQPSGWWPIKLTSPRRWWRPWKSERTWFMCNTCYGTGLFTNYQRVGRELDEHAPWSGRCECCETPWTFVKRHTTWFAIDKGMDALCEACWADLATAENRLPYYEKVWATWVEWSAGLPTDTLGKHPEVWDHIAFAVELEPFKPTSPLT